MAAWEGHCGDIKTIRTWVDGSDMYGVWVEFTANPPSCAGGLYLPQTGKNRDIWYTAQHFQQKWPTKKFVFSLITLQSQKFQIDVG
jgi:hypothetical protein